MMHRFRSTFQLLSTRFTDELFPSECLGCGQEGNWLCDTCLSQVIAIQSPTCPFCDTLSPLGKTCARCKQHSRLSGSRALWYYKSPIPVLVQQLKYHGIKSSKSFITPRLVSLFEELPLSCHARVLITSVPSTQARLRKYGFNQSEILAKDLAHTMDLDYQPLLGRFNKSTSQTKLGRKARLSNAKGQFYLKKRAMVDGTIVVIIDDVITTGATLSACAALLKQAGAKQVWAITVAKD